ncbi:MAG TPA: hypothetical protein VLM91_23505 [Candidatus Methylomirabilis sp.]|nr:hypothetical protein [Candidatus Methylomirabilis sp.]
MDPNLEGGGYEHGGGHEHEGVCGHLLSGGGPGQENHAAGGDGRHGGGRLHILSAGTLRGREASRRHR